MSNDYECRNQSLWVVGNISVNDVEAKSRIPCGIEHRARIVAEVSMISVYVSRAQHSSSPDIDTRRSEYIHDRATKVFQDLQPSSNSICGAVTQRPSVR